MTDFDKQLAPPDERAELAEELAEQRDESLSLAEWYLKVMGECDFVEQRIDEQAAKIKAQVAARRKALEWRFGRDFREQVERDLAQQKNKRKRSIDYITGRAGFRSVPAKVVVVNKDELMNWAAIHCPDAVPMEPVLHVTPILKHFEATGEEAPGCFIRQKFDKFYPGAIDNEQLGPQAGTDRLTDGSDPTPVVGGESGSTAAPPEAGA